MKQIFCPLWGFIELTPLLSKILDTAEMQRLKDVKQLGATYFVFPSATHTRLEHSLGVCHLARLLGESLQKNQPELKITVRDIEIWQIAALIHDIGHGPFSHLYDHYIKLASEPEHEERGLQLFDKLCQRENISLTQEEIREIHRMVDPKDADIHNWRYQLIANKSSQIDVDKIDYIQRDSFHVGIPHSGEFSRLITGARVCNTSTHHVQMELCWNEKLQFDIYSLFAARYRLHKQVYTHHTVKAFEFIIIEMMKTMRAEDSTMPLDRLSDVAILSRCYVHPTAWGKALLERKHPICIGEHITDNQKDSTVAIRDVLGYIIEEIKIGFVSGNGENPLKKVHYYRPSSPRAAQNSISRKAFTIDINRTSFIIPEKFQERILRLYTWDRDNLAAAQEYWKKLITMNK